MVRLAAVQCAPVFLNRDATLDKACALIAEAGAAGVRLAVFPEAFVPAFPFWVTALPPSERRQLGELYAELVANSVSIPGPDVDRLANAARDAAVNVVIGVNERNVEASDASLYNTLVFIRSDGTVLGKRRKLVPTTAERLVWGSGDGGTFRAFDLGLARVGGLICWENYMPLARYAMYAWGIQILVAPTWSRNDLWIATLRHIAKEGAVFVVSCCTAQRKDAIPDCYAFKSLYQADSDEWINRGNSCLVGPDGSILAGPVAEREEILIAEVDLDAILREKWRLDVAGHYARSDIFHLTVNQAPNPILTSINGAGAKPRDASGDAR